MSTIDYYNDNAIEYAKSTRLADMESLRREFLSWVNKPGGKILDIGCGSGRDAMAFINEGYLVEAMDGSKEMCKEASAYIGRKVRCVDIRTYSPDRRYDGIWACACLLHLTKVELIELLGKMDSALTKDGVLYCNFKYGDFEGERGQRFYLDMNEDTMKNVMSQIDGFEIKKMWTTTDTLPGRGELRWLNVMVGRE